MQYIYLLLIGLFLALLTAKPDISQAGQANKTVWYLPTEDNATKLYVAEIGRGDTVVVLHGGWGAEHSYLLDAVEGLEDEYDFVFYDQRGSLRSPIPDDKAESLISVKKHVQDLETLRTALGVNKINILAHSMGTYLAMAYLDRYPDHVGGMVLSGARPPKGPRTDAERALAEEQKKRASQFMERPAIQEERREEGLLDSEDLSAKEKTLHWRIKFAGINMYHVERWRQMKGGMVFYDQKSGSAAAQTMPETYNFMEELRAHPYPVVVIMGDHDYLDMGARMWKHAAEDLPNTELVIIEKAGHILWIDRPEEFREAVREALNQVSNHETKGGRPS